MTHGRGKLVSMAIGVALTSLGGCRPTEQKTIVGELPAPLVAANDTTPGSSASIGTSLPVGPIEPAATPSTTQSQIELPGEAVVPVGAVVKAADALVGAGNIWEDEYAEGAGAPRTGLTAGLWVRFPRDPARDVVVRVHPGQVVSAKSLRFEITSVDKNAVGLRIEDVRREQPSTRQRPADQSR